ncbi:MAG TPA: histidine kinase, partial [Chryseosolibacter sp.]|nr:histidine kinase [Chryseosolibacter sp.]
FPAFLIVSMGLSLHNGLAVIEGWLGIKSPFVRTPKFNITGKRDAWLNNSYLNPKLNLITVLEGVLCLCYIFAVFKGLKLNDPTLVVFHAMLAIGFGTVFFLSVKPWANA